MANLLKQFNEEERKSLLLYSILYAKKEAKQMKEQYEENIANNKLNKDTIILLYLEKLGFSLEEYGTYLYKEVIVNVIRFLENSDKEGKEQLLEQLNNMYSQFYLELARHNNGMGVKVFHAYIQRSLDRINSKQKGSNLFKNSEYGEKAFKIGNAIKNSVCSNDSSYEICKIRQRNL